LSNDDQTVKLIALEENSTNASNSVNIRFIRVLGKWIVDIEGCGLYFIILGLTATLSAWAKDFSKVRLPSY
jgi:hypothetical protein